MGFFGLSAMSEAHVADLLLPHDHTEQISCEVVTQPTNWSFDRLVTWINGRQTPNTTSIHIYMLLGD